MKLKCKYSSVWDVDAKGRGYVITTNCDVDLETGSIDAETASDEESASVEMLDREFIEIDGHEFAVKDEQVVDLHELRDFVSRSCPNPAV